MGDASRDYTEAPEARRWGGPLSRLYPTLNIEALSKPSTWCWRILPHGALVSVRATLSGKIGKPPTIELRIARRDQPDSEDGWKKWATEMAVFLKHFGGSSEWETVAHVEGKCDSTFRWVAKGRAEPEKCVDCGRPAEKGVYKEPLCNQCAARRGEMENAAGLLPQFKPATEDRALGGQQPDLL